MSTRDAARVSAYFARRDRQAAEDVAGFFDAIGYTADDFAADMAAGGSLQVAVTSRESYLCPGCTAVLYEGEAHECKRGRR